MLSQQPNRLLKFWLCCIALHETHGFGVSSPSSQHKIISTTSLKASPTSSVEDNAPSSPMMMTRTNFLSTLAFLTTSATVNIVHAEDGEAVVEEAASAAAVPEPVVPTPGKSYTISSCPPRASSACISTASVKGNAMKSYGTPWTYNCTPEKAYETLLAILKSESNSIDIAFTDPDALYIQATAKRNLGVTDDIEFYVKREDDVIVYRSSQTGIEDLIQKSGGEKEFNDLGANKKRMERLRKMSNGVFGVMGDLGGEDYYGGASKGGSNGPLGQLKAFYGLQSGGGFEDVFD